jgi:hypothetical protein
MKIEIGCSARTAVTALSQNSVRVGGRREQGLIHAWEPVLLTVLAQHEHGYVGSGTPSTRGRRC